MVKMVGSYTRPEELLTKLVNENSYLKKQIKELKEENSRLRKITEDQEIELQYARYYADEENKLQAVEMVNEDIFSSDIVTYEEWFNTKEYDEATKAYAEYYN